MSGIACRECGFAEESADAFESDLGAEYAVGGTCADLPTVF